MRTRVYVDTSVIGGCLDEEFCEESRALMRIAAEGRAVLLVSDILIEELARAPQAVKDVLTGMPSSAVERVSRTEESKGLRDAYLEAGVVGPGHENDAHHVALATTARADLIVSWNFRHIVHLDKIRLFNSVNLREGYALLEIRSPREFV